MSSSVTPGAKENEISDTIENSQFRFCARAIWVRGKERRKAISGVSR